MGGGGEYATKLARQGLLSAFLQEAQHNCTACHSCIPLSVSQADPTHPPLYWFLLGLRSLITYTCSWEMQAWLRGEGPSDEVSFFAVVAFTELPPWSWIWDGQPPVMASGQWGWGGGGPEPPDTRQSSLEREHEKACL